MRGGRYGFVQTDTHGDSVEAGDPSSTAMGKPSRGSNQAHVLKSHASLLIVDLGFFKSINCTEVEAHDNYCFIPPNGFSNDQTETFRLRMRKYPPTATTRSRELAT